MIKSVTYFRFLLLVAALYSPGLFGQSTDKNFVLERTYKGVKTTVSGNIKEATQEVVYFDGLGRPLQNISAQASPLVSNGRSADLVSHTEYDALGRVSKVYAPYPEEYVSGSAGNGRFVTGAAGKSVAFYNVSTNFDQNNARGYALTDYEASPLNRISKQFAVGSDRSVALEYGVNAASEVRLYKVATDNSLIDDNAYYGASQLSTTSTTDENGSLSIEYKDKNGSVVLKSVLSIRSVGATAATWQKTYYVYDDLSRLRFVLQPEYQREASVTKYAFKYTYNDRGLLDSKYVPGGGTTLMTYDSRDRLIESKDGNNKIAYFKYDELDRVIETGEKVGTAYRALVKTHYDNYTPSFGGAKTFVGIYGNGYPTERTLNVKGRVTVTATRVLKPTGDYDDVNDVWLYATTFYDERLNVIQTIRDLFDLGGTNNNYEHVTRQLRFDGRVEKELILQKVSTGEHTVEKQYEYDHGDRLLSTRYIVKRDGTEKKNIVIAASRYDGLGQLKKKFLNSTNASTFLEQLDYSYIPRGWMSKVTGKTSAGENFGVELKYANGTIPQYNGNIGDMLWKRGSAWVGYKFTYDDANRLTKGEGLSNDYSETVSSYDLNGNIKGLQRKNGAATWDNLTYDYPNGNRLNKVTDTGTAEGFNNGSSATGTDYDYDGNGNLIQDQNRGIANGGIRYNILNLPREVVINGITMQYHYDATGSKLRMQRSTDNTKYAGIFEYNSSNYITRIATEEGQIAITNNGNSINDYSFQYYLKDHLGNTRQVINEAGTLLQETEYFPFGLEIPRTAGTNKYTFLNREKQPETGYMDLVRRFYDPTTGRFMQVDPVTETQEHLSVYQYGWNNPILRSDPNGDCPSCPQGEEAAKVYAEGATVTNKDGSWTWSGGKWTENAVVRAYEPGLADQWSQGDIGQRFIYGMADGVYSLFADNHLGGRGFDNYDDKIKTRLGGVLSLAGPVLRTGTTLGNAVKGGAQLSLGTTRMRLLNNVENPQLKKMIDFLYREGSKFGNGSTGSMIREELANGTATSASGSHLTKGQGALNSMRGLLKGNHGNLSNGDREIVFEIIEDLTNGTGLKW